MEPMTVKDLISYLQKNCKDDDYVFILDEGTETNLYEEGISKGKYSVTIC